MAALCAMCGNNSETKCEENGRVGCAKIINGLETAGHNEVGASKASGLPVLMPGTACHHIFIAPTTLLLVNVYLKPNFSDQHMATDD